MGWASDHINKLLDGEVVKFRPKGGSMTGKVESGQLCTVEPHANDISVGDIVLCKVKGNEFLHLVKEYKDDKYLIGNNKGGINGWISIEAIFGKLVKVEP